MAIFLQVDLDDPFTAHDLTAKLVLALREDGLALRPASDGSMGGLKHEFMALGRLSSREDTIGELAHAAVIMGRNAPDHAIILEHDDEPVILTLDEAQNRTLIRDHLLGIGPVRLVVR
jgi:hypothetical protein